MNYKTGDKFNIIIPGFSPTVARIDNISEKDGETFYHISFQEEHLYTICRVVSERVFAEMIETYDKNKDNLEPFMMMREDFHQNNETDENRTDDDSAPPKRNTADITSDASAKFEVKAETEPGPDFSVGRTGAGTLAGLTSERK